ncbi:MAG: H-X9-DG-CTERM domain-containing protein [Armatimonadota bacterium]
MNWDWLRWQVGRRARSLLTVLAFFAALTAVLGGIWLALQPALRRARARARWASCASNVKSVALMLRVYAADNDERLPPSTAWTTAAALYLKNVAELDCPEVPESRQRSYAFNSNLDGVERLADVRSPGRCPMVWDSSTLRPNAADPGTSVAARHLGGANVAFADAHVKLVRDPSALVFDPLAPGPGESRKPAGR